MKLSNAILRGGILLATGASCLATPANRAGLAARYDHFLSKELNQCVTCHLPSQAESPQTLKEFPHNPFGSQLRRLGLADGRGDDIEARLAAAADDDADRDGVPNELELLLGANPGDAKDTPLIDDSAKERQVAFDHFLQQYRWRPFETPPQPELPEASDHEWADNPIDLFLSEKHAALGLKPQAEAPPEVLLRRVYLDLIGITPTPEEQREFLADPSQSAYEKVVDRLLNDWRYGERWGRHWMDVWRYSDWAGWSGGNQIRDSKPHIWRWRDWIVESLNQDKGYDQMVVEMLAADEAAPMDTNALRATGFLVRNFKLLSREQWMEDTIKHTSQAFLGLTMGCAKCHDHMYDPISQADYYQMRAIFEPHHVRTDRVPRELDTAKEGLVRAYDSDLEALTYFFIRGDERTPDTNRVMTPDVPAALRDYGAFKVEPVQLPALAVSPDKRPFVKEDLIDARQATVDSARAELIAAQSAVDSSTGAVHRAELNLNVAEKSLAELKAQLEVEALEDRGDYESEQWRELAMAVQKSQRELKRAQTELAFFDADRAFQQAEQKVSELTDDNQNQAVSGAEDSNDKREKELAKAKEAVEKARKELTTATDARDKAAAQLAANSSTEFEPREIETFPSTSTGRRLAFARWLAHPDNPLTARVAANHIWTRRFGRGLVPTPQDFGRNGGTPSHPELLDWLAHKLIDDNWRMKPLHRLMITSRAYRMDSRALSDNAAMDPDNIYLWRLPSQRMEAELIRDNVLAVSGGLDLAAGGPDIDHQKGLTSPRRSLYLRIAAQKEVEFLKIFDGPSVTECYQRHTSVVPQQALAMVNSSFTFERARSLARDLSEQSGEDHASFVSAAFRRILARAPDARETKLCLEFLRGENEESQKARERLAHVLLNHNDFVSIR